MKNTIILTAILVVAGLLQAALQAQIGYISSIVYLLIFTIVLWQMGEPPKDSKK